MILPKCCWNFVISSILWTFLKEFNLSLKLTKNFKIFFSGWSALRRAGRRELFHLLWWRFLSILIQKSHNHVITYFEVDFQWKCYQMTKWEKISESIISFKWKYHLNLYSNFLGLNLTFEIVVITLGMLTRLITLNSNNESDVSPVAGKNSLRSGVVYACYRK